MAESHRDEITKLEALYSDNPEGRVFTLLAEAYRKAGELDHAREVLEGGIKRHSGYASAYVVLGRVLLDQKQGPAAEDAFRRVLELDPENLVALRALGDSARTTGRQQEAIKYYRELLMLDPSDEELQNTVATLQSEIGAQEAAGRAAAPVDVGGWNAPPPETAGVRDSQVSSGSDFGNISIDPGGLSLPDSANFGDISMQSGSGNMLSLDPEPAGNLGGSFSLDSSDAILGEIGGDITGGEDELGGTMNLGGMDLGGGTSDFSGGDLGATTSDGGVAPGEFGDLPDFGGFSLDSGPVNIDGLSDSSFDPGDVDTIGLPPLSFEPIEEASAGATDLPLLDGPPSPALPAEALSWSPEPVDMLDTPVAGESIDDSFRPFAPVEDEPGPFPFTSDGAVHEEEPALETWSPDQPVEDLPTAHVQEIDEDAPWAGDTAAPVGDLATETMAELYTSQGLHARAVEVYRALLRERPDDERLYAKLHQAEFEVRSQAAANEPPAIEEEVEPESAWTAAPSPAGQEQTPYAWADEEEQDAGPQIGAYFSSLLSWRSTVPRAKREESVPTPGIGGTEPDEVIPLAARASQKQSAAAAAAEADTDLSWLEEPEEPSAVAAAPAPAPASKPAPPAPKPAAAAPTPEDDLSWLFDDEPEAAATPSPEASSGKQESAPEPEGGDDDDLEMFRAWLQSLKR